MTMYTQKYCNRLVLIVSRTCILHWSTTACLRFAALVLIRIRLTRRLRLLAAQMREILSDETFIPSVALQADCGVDVARVPYLATATTFISPNWGMYSLLLSADYSMPDHTSSAIAASIKEDCKLYGINNRALAFVSDNAAAMLSASNVLAKSGITSDKQRCVCHLTQLSVNDAKECTATMQCAMITAIYPTR
jgi:hypothetical protein